MRDTVKHFGNVMLVLSFEIPVCCWLIKQRPRSGTNKECRSIILLVLLPVHQPLPRHRALCHFLGSSCGEPRQTDSNQSAEECAVIMSSDAKVYTFTHIHIIRLVFWWMNWTLLTFCLHSCIIESRKWISLEVLVYYLRIILLLNALICGALLWLDDPRGFSLCNQPHSFYLEPEQCIWSQW